MNNVVLVGRITKDIELRTTTSGISTCSFSLAVNGRVNANGERQTDFINIVVWRKQAENVAKYCQKGSLVGVTGRISTRSYDAQDGTKRYVTEVVADNVTFLGSKSNNTGDFETNDVISDYNNDNNQVEATDLKEDPLEDFGSEVVLSDDDLPF